MSRTVRAQELANESNEKIAQETNQANRDIASQANEYNYRMFSEQNQWNLDQWNRENAYNDPSAQVERYIKAGINPLWALGNGDPGAAQHLESASAQPAEVAKMEPWRVNPEFDPYLAQHVANINTAANNLVNGLQGFAQLGLQAQDVETRARVGTTQAELNRASAVEKKASAVGREIENAWNLDTFGVRAKAESQKLHNMEEQYNNMKADTSEKEAKRLEIDAHRDLIREQTNAVIAGIRQRDRELMIQQQSVGVQQQSVDVQRSRYELESERFSKELQKWNNEALLTYMYKFGREVSGEMSAKVGAEGLGVSGRAGIKEMTPATLEKAKQAGIVILERFAENPSESQASDASQAAELVSLIQAEQRRRQVIPIDKLFNSSSSSILNPSEHWNQ